MVYYNRFNPADRYREWRFHEGRALQSAEVNELQSLFKDMLSGVSNVLFRDGAVLADAIVFIDPTSGLTQLGAGLIYLRGGAHPVRASTFSIPVDQNVQIGVYVTEEVVTYLDEPGLRDPATGTRNFNQAGADRLRVVLTWGYEGDTQEGDFYSIYDVENGILINQEPPPQIAGVNEALATYDRESNGGSYIVDGLRTTVLNRGSPNLTQNPDFAADATGWGAYRNGVLTTSGGRLRVQGAAMSNFGFRQTIADDLVQDQTYRVSFDARDVDSGATQVVVQVDKLGQVYMTRTFDGLTTALQSFSFDFIGRPGNARVTIYVVGTHNGQTVEFDNVEFGVAGDYALSVDRGVANVNGYKVSRTAATRVTRQDNADLRFIESEAKVFADDGSGRMTVQVNRGPLQRFVDTDVQFRRSEDLTRGPVANTADTVPEPSVVNIVRINQGSTVYTQGTDYRLLNGTIDWSLGGREPAGGSTYTVQYDYIGNATVDNITPDGFRIAPPAGETIVAGSSFTYDYFQKLPRRDRIVLNVDGELSYVEGVGHPTLPQIPATPVATLALCTVSLDWNGPPQVENDGILAITFSQLDTMQQQIDDLFFLVSEERLKANATALAPAALRGVFVDPFLDDDLRDQGIAQSMAVFGGIATLPIDVTVYDLVSANLPNREAWTLDKSEEFIISQVLATSTMRINPYQAFEPLPAVLSVVRANDIWVDERTEWTSAVTREIVRRRSARSGRAGTFRSVSAATEVVNRRSENAQFCRQITLQLSGRGFGAGERVSEVMFDGIPVATVPQTITANSDGEIAGQFVIPANVPTGMKVVDVRGAGGGEAQALFLAEGTINVERLREVRTQVTTRVSAAAGFVVGTGGNIRRRRVDPLAQTFTLRRGRHITGVDVIFAALGNNPQNRVVLEIRTTQVGFPTQEVVANTSIFPADITADGETWTTIRFDSPVWLEEGREYAIVLLTDDPTHSVRVAQLGEFDAVRQEWVTAQPYQIGVLLSSSNASTWTAHQEIDLAFRLRGSTFTANSRMVDLGQVPVEDVSDILLGAAVETPSSVTDAVFALTTEDGAKYETREGFGFPLPAAQTGMGRLQIELRGNRDASPVVHPDLQLILGKLEAQGVYVSRAIEGGPNVTIRVVVDTLLPGTSTLEVAAEGPPGVWNALTVESAMVLSDGYTQITYSANGVTYANPTTRIRLTLRGTAANRPELRNLRAFIT